MKILFGCAYPDSSVFDERLRINGSRMRIARKGKEWFALDSKFRVFYISSDRDSVRRTISEAKRSGVQGWWRLHNIEGFNMKRCSTEKSKEIYDSLKR